MNLKKYKNRLRTYRVLFVLVSLILITVSYFYGEVEHFLSSILLMGVIQLFHLMMINSIINGDEVIYTPRGISADAGSGTVLAVFIGFIGHHVGILLIFTYTMGLF